MANYVDIQSGSMSPDHVHLLVSVPPSISLSEVDPNFWTVVLGVIAPLIPSSCFSQPDGFIINLIRRSPQGLMLAILIVELEILAQ